MHAFLSKYKFQLISAAIQIIIFFTIRNVYLIKPAKETVVFKTRIIKPKEEKPEKKEIKPQEILRYVRNAGTTQPKLEIKTPKMTDQVKLDKIVNVPTITTHTTIKEPEKKNLAGMEKITKSKDLFATKTGPVSVSEFYAGRTSEIERGSSVSEYGGSARTEESVKYGLEYLHDSQKSDGSWGKPYFVGVTGLALMAYIGSGYTDTSPKSHKYNKTVKKAIAFLIRNEQYDGKFSDRIYESAIATMALSETYIMTKKSSLKPVILKGLKHLLNLQRIHKQVKEDTGGWQGYSGYSELYPSAWALMALQSVKNADIEVPQSAINDATNFIKKCAIENEGFSSWTQQACEHSSDSQESWWSKRDYKPYECEGECGGTHYGPLGAYPDEEFKSKKHTHSYGAKPSIKRTADPTSTGLGALCLMFLGEGDSEEVKEAIKMIRKNWMPSAGNVDYVRWYYTGQAMFQYSKNDWNAWNNTMREVLPKMQKSEGVFTSNNKEEEIAGDAYNTTMAILSLEIYYRYSPMWKK